MTVPLPDDPCRLILAGRPVWLFADGTILPVVAGGSDVPPPPGDAGATIDEADEAPDADDDEDLSDEEFDAALDAIEQDPTSTPKSLAEVRRIRAQVAKQRERTKDLSFIDTFHPDDRTFLVGMLQDLQANPQNATVKIAQVLQSIWGDQLPDVLAQIGLTPAQAKAVERKADQADVDDVEDAGPDLSDPKALAEYVQQQIDARDAERERQRERQQAIDQTAAQITDRLAKLGITDPRSEAGWLVLSAARDRYNFDIEAAYKALVKQGLRLPGVVPAQPAGAEAPTRPAAPEGAADPGAAGQKPVSRDEILRLAQQRATERFDRRGVPAT